MVFGMNSGVTGWKLPFNLALLFHVFILSSALVIPKYLHKKPNLPEFLTVDLVNISAPLPEPVVKSVPKTSAPPAKPIVSKPKPKISKPKKTAPIAPVVPEVVIPTPVPAPVKAISIKPIKRKIKKKIKPDTRVADARKAREAKLRKEQTLERQRQQLLEEAQRKKALADAEEVAANDAVKALKQMLQTESEVVASTAQASPTPTPRTGGGSNNIVESQYQAAIFSSLHEHWALPEIKPWNPELTAVVVIHIALDGRIISHSFEKRSGDRVFDQFVSRTIQEATPLPAIPPAMHVQQYSIGLRFKPGKIQ
jgi:colicin import membrane protein